MVTPIITNTLSSLTEVETSATWGYYRTSPTLGQVMDSVQVQDLAWTP